MAVWRAGVTGAVGEDAVDGTLLASEELAQRCALSTSPSHNSSKLRKVIGRRAAAARLKKPDQWSSA